MKICFLILFFLLIPKISWGINTCATGFRVVNGTTVKINCNGVCRNVINNSGKNQFISTSVNGWSSFISNLPTNVFSDRCWIDKIGPQTNVAVSNVTAGGWTQCWSGGYDQTATISTVLSACNRNYLMMACRPTANATLTLAAVGHRSDVTYNVGSGNGSFHTANGSNWYYSTSKSWGFANQGQSVNRSSCDNNSTDAEKRMCWHTGSSTINTGWRCGTNTSLGTGWERLFYNRDEGHANNECNSLSVLNDATRSTTYTNQSNILCDSTGMNNNWFRFMGSGGWNMPTQPPEIRRCSTSATGWVNGTLPTTDGQWVSRNACFHWTDTTCRLNLGIEIRNCGEYNVYRLPNTGSCSYRYCSDPQTISYPAQCTSYNQINDTSRLTSNGAGSGLCDNTLSSGAWYRFVGGGGRIIPTSSPGTYRCGTHATGWLNGSYPGNGSTVTRQVCYHWSSSTCWWSNNIEISNCGNYYVFRLYDPPQCSLRYCTQN